MSWLRVIAAEIASLFIDDGRLALAIVLWPIALWLLFALSRTPTHFAGPALFVGLVAVLAESALRRARK